MKDHHDDHDDPILDAFVDGTAYERLQFERFSHFKGSVTRKLTVHSVLLGVLALLFPLYELYPRSAGSYVPSLNPVVASPKVLLLGMFGGTIELGAATVLVLTAVYRIRNAPLTERQATSVLDAETFATYIGYGTGGLAVSVTVAFFVLGLGGESTLGWYVATMGGVNPFSPSGMGVSVAHVATGALAGSVVVLSVRAYLENQLSTAKS